MGRPRDQFATVVWNSENCRAVCKRPEGTTMWVQCRECFTWYHIVCVDWFCSLCRTSQPEVTELQQQVEQMETLLGKREEEVSNALMKVEEEGAMKAQALKSVWELESQL